MFPPTSGGPLQHSAVSAAETMVLVLEEVPVDDQNENAHVKTREVSTNIPQEVTFVTGNEKKRKEVEEILLTYQTPFQLISEKVRFVHLYLHALKNLRRHIRLISTCTEIP